MLDNTLGIFNLSTDNMDEPPTQQKQLAKFKKGLLPCIKQKMEIWEYVNLQDTISQAKLVVANCIAENDDNFDTGLTQAMIQCTNIQLFLLRIHA